eukprot:m.615195 g.615195  ORF g.615195 m.615195 type:complete len:85 (-) comp58161_c0_seq9:56-310(-)
MELHFFDSLPARQSVQPTNLLELVEELPGLDPVPSDIPAHSHDLDDNDAGHTLVQPEVVDAEPEVHLDLSGLDAELELVMAGIS